MCKALNGSQVHSARPAPLAPHSALRLNAFLASAQCSTARKRTVYGTTPRAAPRAAGVLPVSLG
eukprot:6793881-Alexandrium_andersonii.AAC.1